MISAKEALERLREGNSRFVSEESSGDAHTNQWRRRQLIAGQALSAIILGCSDSRVPAEIVFDQSPNLRTIVDRIRPSVQGLLETELARQPEALLRQAVRANIRASANHLRHGSAILEHMIEQGKLRVIGAEYSLETGVVEFFDGMHPTDKD